MTLFLDRVDAAPILHKDFDADFLQWLWVLVDTLNENLSDIQGAVNSTSSVDGIAQDVEVNSNYIPTNIAQTVFQLPDTASVGSRVSIIGQGAGGWQLLAGAGQTIEIASVPDSGTSFTSSSQYDCISIVCVVEDTTWVTESDETAGFVIV